MTRQEVTRLLQIYDELMLQLCEIHDMVLDAMQEFAKEDAANTALEQQQQRAADEQRQRPV